MSETPTPQVRTAATDVLTRTKEAIERVVETLTEPTERLSAEVVTNARHVVDSAQEAGERVRAEVTAKAEPTAEQVTEAVNELIAWARQQSDRLATDIDEFRTGLEARFAPATRAELAALEARVAAVESKLDKAL